MKSSETYIVTAKTVDEAMAIAQREYGGSGKDISFDILEMPKKGFLGIGAKDARIKVTVTEEEEIDLGAIVAEMKSYRLQTDREGGETRKKNEKPAQPKAEKPAQPKQEKQDKPAEAKPAEPRQPKAERPAQPKQEQPKAERPAQPKQEQPKADRPAQAPKAEKPVQPKQDKQDKPAEAKPAEPRQPKAERPAQPRQEQPKPERPAQPKQEQLKADRPAQAPKTEKPAQPKQDKQDKPVEAKSAFDTARAGEKPVKKEVQASGILDNMPEYKITDSGKKTPVYKETGANVKTYNNSPMHTAAVADGSIAADSTPVVDVRWDSARDLKKAEEAAAAAMAAASRAAAPVAADAPVAEKIAKVPEEAAEPVAEEEEVYVPSDGSIDVAALDAAIEAMVEELPAPESRKKTGITAAEMEYAIAFVTTLLANMQIDAKAVAVACPEGEEYEIEGDANVYPAMEIVGEGTGILIGHHGETLDAIQYLLNLAAIRHSDNPNGDYVKISLDIENYRAKREETLRSLARRMAARALKYKRNVFLEPMNAYERRIIHSELQSVENVSTHSVGTDKNRKIIITYEGPDKVFDDRRRADKPESGENRRRDHGRNRKPKNDDAAPAAEAPVEAEDAEGTEKPQGEHKSRNRNRNRNRNRRRRSEGEGAPAEAAEVQPQSAGAAAIISGAEKEALNRQLSDPTVGGRKPQQEISLEDLPSFLQKSADEPAEHLREN